MPKGASTFFLHNRLEKSDIEKFYQNHEDQIVMTFLGSLLFGI